MALDALSYMLADQRRMSAAKNYFAWQAAMARPALGRRVLEVGCGIGNFTEFLLDCEAVIAVDSEPDCLVELQARFPERGNLHVLRADGADLRACERFHPDSCVCLNVLEHIADDEAALAGMASLLPRGGKIALLLPAFPALYGPIDRNLGHYRRYRHGEVVALAAAARVEIETLHYVNLPGFFAWWMNSRVLRRTEQSAEQIWLFDRWMVPAISRVEKLARVPLGQSLFAILVKR